MSSPLPYLVRMLFFLAAVGGLAYVLHEDLLRVFLNTPILNSIPAGPRSSGVETLPFPGPVGSPVN